MTKSSREKGKRGEREVRDLWQRFRPLARRSGHEQAQGVAGAADVDVGPGYAVEVKRYKRLSWTVAKQALAQAEAVTEHPGRGHDVPIAFLREDKGRWLCLLDADQLLAMIEALDKHGRNLTRRELDHRPDGAADD
jgi:hypothetical protein